ncbi:hypothetical protein pipiens_014591 [Culex pipiens pipiens]|uniref:Uncharacterized protein n=1 Tax=Culex pipiens pipiens TaxID=38569 RepID=A0ABD1CTZ8_CULPP
MEKLLILIAVVAAVASAKSIDIESSQVQPIESIGIKWSQVQPIENSAQYWARLPAEMQYLRKQEPDHRIVNGQEATPGQFPFQVYLEFQTASGGSSCGGMEKLLLLIAVVAAVASAKSIDIDSSQVQPIESIGIKWSQIQPIEDSDQYWARLPEEMQYLRKQEPDRRIVNGQEATPGQFPYQVFVNYQENGIQEPWPELDQQFYVGFATITD